VHDHVTFGVIQYLTQVSGDHTLHITYSQTHSSWEPRLKVLSMSYFVSELETTATPSTTVWWWWWWWWWLAQL